VEREKYVVFEDLNSKQYITKPSDKPVKIHKATCPHAKNKANTATKTTRWSTVFDCYKEADDYAKQTGKPYRNCEICFRVKSKGFSTS
jgi:hypothetical protein